MGRLPLTSYQVRDTLVEFAADDESKDTFVGFATVEESIQSAQVLRTTAEKAYKRDTVQGELLPPPSPLRTPSPSPLHRPQQAPEALLSQMASMPGFQLDASFQDSAAVGDSVDLGLNSYPGGMIDFGNCCQVYHHPTLGLCMPVCPVQYSTILVPAGQDGSIPTWYIDNEGQMHQSSFVLDVTQFDEHGQQLAEAIREPCDAQLEQEATIDLTEGEFPSLTANSSGGKRNRNRHRGDRENRAEHAAEENADVRDQDAQNDLGHCEAELPLAAPLTPGLLTQVPQHQGPVDFTTVMLRNIPNKYSREMLINQFLQQSFEGQFDFVYLPIDFKNKCNVGYAFINFFSVEACQRFVTAFHGVEVRKIHPGLNSRKEVQVTRADRQGFEANVERLRNSPIMVELAEHPEWMPLIFDENGEELAFPAPERPLEPIKPRNRRDKEA